MQRVLMFGWEFPPYNSGGLGVACFGLATALSAQQVGVNFVLPYEVEIDVPGIRFLFADKHPFKGKGNNLPSGYATSKSFARWLSKNPAAAAIYGNDLFGAVARYASRALEVAEQVDFDVIHSHDWLTFGAGMAVAQETGKPLVVHVHATEFDRTGGGANPFVYNIEQQGVQQADQVIAVSGYTKHMVMDEYQVPADKIKVVHNGINIADYRNGASLDHGLQKLKQAGYKLALFVGRFTLQKGPDYFLEAAAKVLQYEPKTLFVMTGSGDMEHMLIERAAQLGISDHMLFTGFLRGAELSGVYALADLFVMSSVSEPFGLVALEAVSNRIPVIVSRQSGVSEVLHHSLKADFWDTDLLADLMLGVLRYPAIVQPMTQHSFREAQSLSWESAARKVRTIYQSLAASPAIA